MPHKRAKAALRTASELKERPEYINARWLLRNETDGTYRHFAEIIERTPQQVGAMINEEPSRILGETLARHIETKFARPPGWLSTPHKLSEVKPLGLHLHGRDAVKETGSPYEAKSLLVSDIPHRQPADPEWFDSELQELQEKLTKQSPDVRIYKGAPHDLLGTSTAGFELTNLLNHLTNLYFVRDIVIDGEEQDVIATFDVVETIVDKDGVSKTVTDTRTDSAAQILRSVKKELTRKTVQIIEVRERNENDGTLTCKFQFAPIN